MVQIIRTYDNPKTASAVVSELKAANFDKVEQVSDGNGGSIVAVEPPFGMASKAEAIFSRVPGGRPSNGVAHLGNGAAGTGSISSSTRLTGAPRLTDSRTTSEWIGLPTLIDSNTFVSGFPLLIGSKPFSSLAKNQNASARLIDNPAPLSSMLGLPVLIGSRK
jgi:hypothetical protein